MLTFNYQPPPPPPPMILSVDSRTSGFNLAKCFHEIKTVNLGLANISIITLLRLRLIIMEHKKMPTFHISFCSPTTTQSGSWFLMCVIGNKMVMGIYEYISKVNICILFIIYIRWKKIQISIFDLYNLKYSLN